MFCFTRKISEAQCHFCCQLSQTLKKTQFLLFFFLAIICMSAIALQLANKKKQKTDDQK